MGQFQSQVGQREQAQVLAPLEEQVELASLRRLSYGKTRMNSIDKLNPKVVSLVAILATIVLLVGWQGGMTYPTRPAAISGFCGGTVGTGNGVQYALTPAINSTNVSCNHTIASSTPGPIGIACTLKNLSVAASTAGAVSGSGVITVLKNGTGTGITCTLGTGTSCTDSTHTTTITENQTIAIVVATGQATDTTADIKAVVQCQ
jgi:hypothetical protein